MPSFTRKLSDLYNEGFNFGLTPEDYPIFDESYRDRLNDKILKHYWNYEIGQETESMFRFSLNRKMNEIMPLYNQIYQTEFFRLQNQIDPLQTVNLSDVVNVTGSNTANKDSSGNATNTSGTKGRVVGQETPQVLLSPDEDYASSAQNSVSQVTSETDQTGTETETGSTTADTTHTAKGSQGLAGEIIAVYRAALLNVDMMVIAELGTLFMQIWDNGDEYTKHSSVGGIGFGTLGFGFGYGSIL
jgi:hypothetical protein